MVLVCKSYPILIVTDIHIIKVWPETGYINYGRDYNLRLKFILIFYTWNLYGMLHPLLYKSCVFLRLMSSIIKLWSMRANQKQSITWCPLLFNWYIVVVWQIYLQVLCINMNGFVVQRPWLSESNVYLIKVYIKDKSKIRFKFLSFTDNLLTNESFICLSKGMIAIEWIVD